MKIFSAFDTKFKNNSLLEQQQKYGYEKVHLLEKSHFFLLKQIIIPFIIIIIVTLIWWYISIEHFKISSWMTIWIMCFIFIVWLLYAMLFKHYIDYKMDYCIITPEEIILTEQSWIFNRWIRTLDTAKIKSISIQKKSIIHSLFNNWDIVFMSDGDDKLWEIILEYIHNPEWQKSILQNIIIREE